MTRRTLRLLALAAAGLVPLACADAGPTDRGVPYDYTIPLTPSLVFHWPESALPVRIWVDNATGLGHAVAAAIAEWERNAPYGEFHAVIQSDTAGADVLVTVGVPHEAAADFPDRPCDSHTSWAVTLNDSTLVLPFRTELTAHSGFDPNAIADCFDILAVHELGHVVGIIGNSLNPDDAMYGLPTTDTLSAGDRATFLRLYHSTSTVRLPRTRH